MMSFPLNRTPAPVCVLAPGNACTVIPDTCDTRGRSGATEPCAPTRASRAKATRLAPARLESPPMRKPHLALLANTQRPVRAIGQEAPFLSNEGAMAADAHLQKTLIHWLVTGRLNAHPIAQNASINPFTEAFSAAVHAPSVRAWFKAKGLDWSTLRVYNDGVDGEVMVNGERVRQRFTTTDGSGWWEVGAKVSEAVDALCPDYTGVVLPDEQNGDFRDVRVMLGFYGAKAPTGTQSAAQIGNELKQNGWPPITDATRTRWAQQHQQLLRKNNDRDARSNLASQLQALIKDKASGETLNLADVPVNVASEATLAHKSRLPRERFVEWLATPAFQAFIKKSGVDGVDNLYRICDGKLEVRDVANQWRTLHTQLEAEISKVGVDGSADEKAGVAALSADFAALVQMSKVTGDALYSQPRYDARQFLAFSGLGTPGTVAQVKGALGWLTYTMPPSPIGGDYAGLSPYNWTLGALSQGDLALLKSSSQGAGSVKELLRRHTFAPGMPDDHQLKLQHFFDSPNAIAKAQELARLLKMAEVADGKPLSRATRHQLLATAIKVGIAPQVPGRQGEVAGYAIYQPANFGRTLDEVRAAIETHLKSKGADTTTAPLVAHLFLAQAAPEFLLKPAPHAPAQALEGLAPVPGQVSMGSTSWMNLRLACAMAEKLGGAGSSRALNITQAQMLTRLVPMVSEQEQLLKCLGAQPLLDWAVMTGVIPKGIAGTHSAAHYRVAAEAFLNRETAIRNAFDSLTSEPPNQTNLLIEQLAGLFPEMTREELRSCRVRPAGVGLLPLASALSNEPDPLLTDVILQQQTPSGASNVLLPGVIQLLKDLGGYRFNHGTISQATFEARISKLPLISALVAPAVDQYLVDARSAQETVIRQMIANAPLDVRRILEVAQIQVFSLREATGNTLLDDNYDPASVAAKVGRQGVLIRYDTKTTNPTGGYFEFFPGSMKIVRRDDLRDSLKFIGGEVKERHTQYRRESYRAGRSEAFDFQAYSTASAPRPNQQSDVIVEKAGPALPGLGWVSWPAPASEYVPDSWASAKTAAIANAIADVTFDEDRARLIEYARQPTAYQKIRSYPFGAGNVFSMKNVRTLLSLIPFIGGLADIIEGNVGTGIKGLIIDFTSLVATGGLAAAKSLLKGLKVLVPFSNRAFAMRELKGTLPFLRSLFNPLDGAVDVLKTAQRALAGQFVAAGPGLVMATTAFEKCRWGVGLYSELSASPTIVADPGGRQGVSQGQALRAVLLDSAWYAIDPLTHKPTGTPLADFTPDN